jgi:hypothetical protein
MSALASLLLVFVLPALAGGILLSGPAGDGDAGGKTAGVDVLIARGLACGLGAWLIGSGLITATVGVSATSAWIWDAIVATGSVAALLLPQGRSRLRTVLGPAARRLGVATGLTALVYAPLGYAVVRTSWSPLGSTPWYYYGLAQQVADAGSIPATSIEFATATPFLNDYHLFTTGTALFLVQDADNSITVITIVTLLGVVLLGVGAVVLASLLGAGRLASLLAVPVALATGIGPARLAAYRPEGFALGLTLLVVALAIDWLRRRDWRSLLAAVLIAAALSQVHGIAATAAAAMIVAAALVSLIRERSADQLQRAALLLVALLGAVVVTGLAFREASGTVHAGGLINTGGLADPTWEFFMAARDMPPSDPQSNGDMVVDTIRGMYLAWSWVWIVPALLLAGYGLFRRRRDPVVRRLVGFTAVALVGLAAVACVFMFAWQSYVPRRTGASRIVLEMSLLVPPFVAIGLASLARHVSERRQGRRFRSERSTLLACLTALSVLGMVAVFIIRGYNAGQHPSRSELEVWEALPVTSSDVILANGYTEGFIPDVTGAQGLLDGRAPYTFGDLLERANTLFRDAQAFFADPAAHWDYLADNGVTWIVVGNPDSESLGTANIWETPPNLTALEACAGLKRVVQHDTIAVFRVVDSGPGGCSPTSG